MTTHVLVVDTKTFKYHLEYLFIGTGAKNHEIDFNNNPNTSLHHSVENLLVSMVADASRVRRGDHVLFYLQQARAQGIYEGKFFGVFRIIHDNSFLDNNDGEQYLRNSLKKSLTFRSLVEPYRVYEEGVTEWEALDEIKHIISPNQMLWSLIYRKLKGHRGNTMITVYEAERLTQLIRNKNNRKELNCNSLSFDVKDGGKLICLNETSKSYGGRKEEIKMLPRLLTKYHENKAFEVHLQAYIMQNLGKGIDKNLDAVLLGKRKIEWMGNEVSCGMGMQRIDIMLSVMERKQRIVMPIELKAIEASEHNIKQIERYVDWVEQYYIPNYQSDIQPILLTRKMMDKQTAQYQALIGGLKCFNEMNYHRCASLRFVEFYADETKVFFEEVSY